ncbi:MAG: tetratricopeptide repeat protein [Cyclobacteriaceae bacterium]
MRKQNSISIYSKIKAGLIACFFFLAAPLLAAEPSWKFDPQLQEAYNAVLNLETDQAYRALARIENTNPLHKLYVQSFCETLDVLISEDEQKFEKIEISFKERLKYLEELPQSAETLFLRAELNLQRGFNFLNLGHELSSVWAIKSAYNLAEECLKKYPNFIPVRKTSGVIQVMIGTVPDKYEWFLSMLGMKGSVAVGQKQLKELQASNSSLSTEATILFYTIKGLINQEHQEAVEGIMASLQEQPHNRLVLFLGVNMLMKNSQSEEALQLIQTLDQQKQGLPMYYIEYLRGEILLQKGAYDMAIKSYRKFITYYKSSNFKKDSYYKISLCYWLKGDSQRAQESFELAKKTGKAVAEPDRYANAQLRENSFPNRKIYKVRLYTDGGYYKLAQQALLSISNSDLTTAKDKAEYFYRKARLADKTWDYATAETYYNRTLEATGSNPWYFAPNAALQLGYLAQQKKEYENARKYFELALSYKKHEYKNSIDSKAKSALGQLNK